MKQMKVIKHKMEKMKKTAKRNRTVKVVRMPNQVSQGNYYAKPKSSGDVGSIIVPHLV